jgi:predicted nucleotidyltransferase
MIAHGIDLDTEAVRDFCRKWKIRELSIFGSVLRDDFGPESDVDFLADYDEDAEWDLSDLMDMRDELAAIVGREVDLLTRAGVEASSNRLLKREILSKLERLYAA